MAQDPPPLALSDIMHAFTPSPSQDGAEDPPSRSTTPDQAQIELFKARVKELGTATEREQELADMVRSATNARI
jgi:hypothetical protein